MGRRAGPYSPIWTISDLYLSIVGYYDRAKFRADHFNCSGVRVLKTPECSIGASFASLKNLFPKWDGISNNQVHFY
jgi:hypothetical protein